MIAIVSGSALTLSMLTGLTTGAQSSEVRGGPAGATSKACDPTGNGDANDCIRHGHHKGASDHVLKGKDKLIVRGQAHPDLHNKSLRTEIQVRALDWSGKSAGSWVTQGKFMWRTTNTDGSAEQRTFSVCAPAKPGLYQVRTKVTVPKASTNEGSVRSSVRATTSYTSGSTTIASNGPNCTNTNGLETLVEYFNELDFNMSISIGVNATSISSSNFSLSCPPSPPGIPPYSLVLYTSDDSASTSCSSSVPITLNTNSPNCINNSCQFTMVMSDPATGAILSETNPIWATINGQSTTVLPQLNPATLPLCLVVISNCELTGQCNATQPLTVTQPSLNDSAKVTFVATTPQGTNPSPSPTPSASPSPTPTPTPSSSPSPSSS